MVKKSFDAPEEIRPIKRGKVEVVDLGRAQAMRVTFEPGWRWLECVKPIVGTDIGTTFFGGIGGLETKRALSDARDYDRINQQPAFTNRRAPWHSRPQTSTLILPTRPSESGFSRCVSCSLRTTRLAASLRSTQRMSRSRAQELCPDVPYAIGENIHNNQHTFHVLRQISVSLGKPVGWAQAKSIQALS
jgi:hypothetical protein